MFKIYSSSAGSGKTYTLTKEYLRLALHPTNEAYFRHILAVTFTNAAAGEMKARIMGMLQLFATSGENAAKHPMLLEIAAELFPEDPTPLPLKLEWLSRRASAVFHRILHQYSDFSVITIDSFMSRLVGSFTDELGLPFGFETRLDADLLSEAVDRLLARVGQDGEEALTRVIESYYREHVSDGKGWTSLPESIRQAALDLLSEQSYLALSKTGGLTLGDWSGIRNQLRSVISLNETRMQHLAGMAMKKIGESGVTANDLYYGARGIYGYFDNRVKDTGKLWDAPNTYVANTVMQHQWYGGKASPAVRGHIDGISDDLEDIFNRMEALRVEEGPRIRLFRLLTGQLYNLSLLQEIKKEFDLLLRQNNQVHISEFNRKVMDIVANDPVPFIFERLGEKYHHILIDEFQDTSKLQFANLLPLIENALSSGYFNLAVGDVKQAIYRFRGGDMDLLIHLSQRKAVALRNMLGTANPFMEDRLRLLDSRSALSRLSVNRRSYREIIDFNNAFFAFLAGHPSFSGGRIGEVYDEHASQQTHAGTREGGHVQIEFFEKEEESSTGAETSAGVSPDPQGLRVIALIHGLRDEGFHWRDIAVLCREKKQARKLAGYLQDAGFPLISDDSLLLSSAQSVALLTGFIKVLYTPGNASQRLETALLFHRVVNGQTPDGQGFELLREMSRQQDLASFIAYFNAFGADLDGSRLQQLGIYELNEQLIASLKLFSLRSENDYLFRYLDEVLRFSLTRPGHTGDFLLWWELAARTISISVSPDTDAIRITTIHKSKGLEYPVILLPYAQWSVMPKPQSRIWTDLDITGYPEFSIHGKTLHSAAVPFQKDLEDTLLAPQYEEEKDRVLLENLNLLYVAFTRPIQRLYVLAQSPAGNDAPKAQDNNSVPTAVNQWIQSFLSHTGCWEEGNLSYVLHGSGSGIFHTHRPHQHLVYTLSDPAVGRAAASPGLRKNAGKIFDTATFEKKKDLFQKLKHVLIHLKHADLVPETIRRLYHSGILSRNDTDVLPALVRDVLSLGPVGEAYDKGASVMSREIIQPDGEILEADRVVTEGSGHCLFFSFHCDENDGNALAHAKKLRSAYQASGFTRTEGVIVDLKDYRLTRI